MPSREYPFNIVLPPGRSAEEEWEVIEPRIAAYWRSEVTHLRVREFEHDGCTVRVEVDWTPLGRRILRDHNIMRPVRKGQSTTVDWYAKISPPLRLKALCIITGPNKFSGYDWYPLFFLQYFLYEVFAISNLACPGAAEFYGLSIEGGKVHSSSKPKLSAFYFDEWMIESVRGIRPCALLLEPATVAKWFVAVNPRLTQKAENGTQRALFSLYHLCRNDGRIDFVMWLFNALESLLATRVGENFSGLVRRASLILQLDSTETARMGKRFRKLYDLRSAFVHGGYNVAHPIHSESIDDRLNEDYGNVLELSKYGFFILAALLQRMIQMNRIELVFEERLVDRQDTA